MDIKQQPTSEEVIAAVHRTLRALYGESITAVLMWLPPGATAMDLGSNADRGQIIHSLRQAADNIEFGPSMNVVFPRQIPIPGAVHLDLARAPVVKFTVACPSCLKRNVVEVDCSVMVFDVIALACPCGVQTETKSTAKQS